MPESISDKNTKRYSDSCFSCLPEIRRARDFRLYAYDNTRYVDLWQHGGKALLGHTPKHFLHVLKNEASRGLYSPFPHPAQRQLEKALHSLLPSYMVRIYRDDQRAVSVLNEAGFSNVHLELLPDPAFTNLSSDLGAALWRPCTDSLIPDTIPLLFPVLPLLLDTAVRIILIHRDVITRFPPSDCISAFVLSCISRTVCTLLSELPERALPLMPATNKALMHPYWIRRGIYVQTAVPLDKESSLNLFKRFLAAGFLLPPFPADPIILPAEISPGEDASLAKLLSIHS